MRHLSDQELLAVVEGGSDGDAHLEACEGCRARAADLRSTLALLRDVEVPEPSPVFWSQLSRRVRERVEAGEAGPASWWGQFGWWRPLAGAGALAILVLAVLVTRTDWLPVRSDDSSRAVSGEAPGSTGRAAMGSDRSGDQVSAAEAPAAEDVPETTDESWALVTDLASDLDLDAATEAGLLIQPGSAQLAVDELSQEERRQFVALLQEELARPEL